MTLPEAFIENMSHVLPADELSCFVQALTVDEQPTSIRLNRKKWREQSLSDQPTETALASDPLGLADSKPVAWCAEGRYLQSRPQFTLDPLLHAGAYYVQEASSQFLTHVLRTFVTEPVTALDLCAAPGGKSTAALSVLPEGSVLVSNEIDRKRARILAENIQKWGNPNVCVTANAPADFQGLQAVFDVLITDVPCSGEGMFRKDAGAIAEWSPAKVHECAALQKQILRDIWGCLKPGGLLVYSTCTFNVQEDEEQLQFICHELGAELLTIPVQSDWHIHPALTGAFAPDVKPEQACRFMPHFTQGEGLFMAALRKLGNSSSTDLPGKGSKHGAKGGGKEGLKPGAKSQTVDPRLLQWVQEPAKLKSNADGTILAIPTVLEDLYNQLVSNRLYLLSAGIELGTQKGKDIQPAHALALSTARSEHAFPMADLDLDTALNYLRREAIVLPPDVPRGYVLLSYRQMPLGFVKNIGNRCNSLYPTEWRIRNL